MEIEFVGPIRAPVL